MRRATPPFIALVGEGMKSALPRRHGYRPRLVYLAGNHEERLERVAEQTPELSGLICVHQVAALARKRGWEFHGFNNAMELGGAFFSHYFPGSRGEPIPAHTLLGARHRSAVFAHSHSYGMSTARALDGQRLTALCVGCYRPEDRLGPGDWSGAVMLHNLRNGEFDVEQFSMSRLLAAA